MTDNPAFKPLTVDGITYRRMARHELLQFERAETRGFGGIHQIERGRLENHKLYGKMALTNCAVDGDEIVGTCAGVDMQVGTPGFVPPMMGITDVTVAPTHRRRGILTHMMRRQLLQLSGSPYRIAALWASESPIYGRFGFGMAVEQQEITIECSRSQFRPDVPKPGPDSKVRFATPKQIRQIGPAIWAQKMELTPGMASRVDPAWERLYRDSAPDGKPDDLFMAIYSESERPMGYVAYRISDAPDEDGLNMKELKVRELIATNIRAEAALWRFVLDIDLVHTVKHESHPVRSMLWRMFEDPRCVTQKPYDALWVRIISPFWALGQRGYSASGSVILEITDDFLNVAKGRYRLEVNTDDDIVDLEPTDDPADIVMPVETLGAIYMGAHDLNALHAANRCTELTPGAVARAAAMFADDRVHHVASEF